MFYGQNYEHLFSVNSPPAEPPARPSKGPTHSHYLLSKVVRARERIEAELNSATTKDDPNVQQQRQQQQE